MTSAAGGSLALWDAYIRLLHRAPVRVKSLTAAFIFAASQTASQVIMKGQISSMQSVAAYSFWGVPSSIGAHYFNEFMVRRGPDRLLMKIFVDHLVYRIPIMALFTYYVKRFAEGLSWGEAWKQTCVSQPQVQKTSMKLWPALMLANYTVVPLQLRVLYLNVCQFCWVIYLALLYGRLSKSTKSKYLNRQDALPTRS
eukprot:TRINITY_DN8789_c0_g2_i1.p1 TRINITY_DN8789_c0_g2~~TRINITY_DN8789_c0_g2_i1.p1  ORF type:complete len:211 (-),score=11.37 TRINITY_DN8789_c0_g2_i1:216-806(-)